MEIAALIGSILGICFASGLNLYLSAALIGLLLKFNLIVLPQQLAGLNVLADPYVLGAAILFFIIELIADKIPYIDSLWDSFHTLVRPLGAFLITTTMLPPETSTSLVIALSLIGGGTALFSHATKASTRLAINTSPEPASNIVVSFIEDGIAAFLIYLSIKYPYAALCIVALTLLVMSYISPTILRLLKAEISLNLSAFKALLQLKPKDDFKLLHQSNLNAFANFENTTQAIAGINIPKFRFSKGYLIKNNDSIDFITRRWGKIKSKSFLKSEIDSVYSKKGLNNRASCKSMKTSVFVILNPSLTVIPSECEESYPFVQGSLREESFTINEL